MIMAIVFCFVGLAFSEISKGEPSCYCLAVSALFLAAFHKLTGEGKMFIGAEILASIFFIMLSLKIRKYRKMQGGEK